VDGQTFAIVPIPFDAPRPAVITADPAPRTTPILVVLVTIPGGTYEAESFDANANGTVAPLATLEVPAGRYGMTLGRDGIVYFNTGNTVARYRLHADGTFVSIGPVSSSLQPVGQVDADGTVVTYTYAGIAPPGCSNTSPWWILAKRLPLNAKLPKKPYIASSALAGPSKIVRLATGDVAVLDAKRDPGNGNGIVNHIPIFHGVPNCNATPIVDLTVDAPIDDIEADDRGNLFTSLHDDSGSTRFAVYPPGAVTPTRVIEPTSAYSLPYTKFAVDANDAIFAPVVLGSTASAVRDDAIAVFDESAGRDAKPARVITPSTWAARNVLVRTVAIAYI